MAARTLRGGCAAAVMAAALALSGSLAQAQNAPADSAAAADLSGAGAAAAAFADNARELESLRRRIQTHRERADQLVSQEQDAAGRLRQIETEIGLVKRLLQQLDARERMLQARSDSLRGELAAHQASMSERQVRVGRRLRALHRRGPRSDLEVLLTAQSYTALVARLRYAAEMGRVDRQLIERLRSDTEQLSVQESELRAALAQLWEAREEARRERWNLEQREAERREELRGVRRQRREVDTRLAELETSARRLTELLADLEQQRLTGRPRPRPSAGSFAAAAGRLVWPVEGELVRPFGRSIHPEFQTVTLHNGVTLAAPRGAPIQAVSGGTVEWVDSLPGYGVCVILDHGDGYYSLYAHTQRVLVRRGEIVEAGRTIAEVGEAEGEGRPLLYFEIRRGKTPQDPLSWLEPRR